MAIQRSVLATFCVAFSFTSIAFAQGRVLSAPASGREGGYGNPAASVPSLSAGSNWGYSSGGSTAAVCNDRVRKERELNALLQKKIDVLEAELAQLKATASGNR